jgi:ribosome-associated protein
MPARGPGGQNVNKVASKAVLRFNLRPRHRYRNRGAAACAGLRPAVDPRGRAGHVDDTHRDQPRNRADVLERLRQLLADAVAVPKRRRKTIPSAAARERRLAEKRARSVRKRQRGRASDE